ncbi:MAG TPA: SpoIIE family protein phosphatase, partial [Acidothermaceae bacterium]|nr:SpoIIE family protein phosphatase [Acidothermaceae bacterium]
RGLALVASLTARWGVDAASDHCSGKLVWAELSANGENGSASVAGSGDTDVSALLSHWDDDVLALLATEPQYQVVLGDVPTDLLLAAKAHVDNVVRELTLASYEHADDHTPSEAAGALGDQLAELVHDVVTGFSEARQSIKRQALAAAARGDERTRLTLTVGASMADAGERYIAALDELDEFARAARLLTVESPPDQRAFRHWYVQSLVDQLRAKARGETPGVPPTFEQYLLHEVTRLATAPRAAAGGEQARVASRLTRLQSVAAELSRRSGVREVAEAAVRHAVAAVDATYGTLYLPTPDHAHLRLIELVGRPEARSDGDWQVLSVDSPLPGPEAFRTGRTIIIGTGFDRPEQASRYEGVPPLDHPVVCLPLRAAGEVGGVLTLSFAPGHRFDHGELAFLGALADQCGQALSRAHALEQATRVGERFAFLAEASRRLAASLNYRQTLQTVADLAVPHLADWCGIDVIEGNAISSVAVAHVDPDKVAFARLYRRLYPQPLDSPGGVPSVIATGESLLVTDITDDMLVARAVDDRQLSMLRELGPSSVLIVPLRAAGRVVGAVSLIRSDPTRPFSAGDVSLAEDVGRRAGMAVENARLFREVQAEWHSDSGTSHARLDLALEAASIGTFDWDLQGGNVVLDERMRWIFGVDAVAFEGRMEGVLDAVLPADRASFDAAVSQAVTRLGDFSTEYRIRRPDGVVRWVDTRGRVLPDVNGKASRLIGVSFDSTELREARDRVARTLEHMDEAFLSLDAEWRVTYVNPTAERLLGRERGSLLGRVVWDEFPNAGDGLYERECRRAMTTQRPVTFERHLPETGHHLQVRIHPIPEGLGIYFADVSQSRQFEEERAQLRAASRHARSEAELARSRLAFIAAASADITTTLDPTEVCRRLASHAVGRLADWVSVYVVDNGVAHRVAAAHRDPRFAQQVEALVGAYPIDLASDAMVARAARTGVPILEQHMFDALVVNTYPDPQAHDLVAGMGVASAFVTPMVARNEVVGVMAFIRAEAGNEFEPDEVQLAVTLASRAALAVQNAQLYERQTTVAQALQEAVLPEALPSIEGVELAARYEPARGGAGIGGDFYDVFRLPSGRIAMAVGDAAGHGLQAGALMGQLRNALRAYAVLERGPAVTLRCLSDLIAALEPDAFATAFYAEFDPRTGEVAWASAGHPPPLLTSPSAPPRYLDGFASPPLGVFTGSDADSGLLTLPPGGGIFMYTDGLVERRRADIDNGLEALRSLLAGRPAGSASVDAVVQGMRDDTGYADDVCVLFAVRS